MESIEKIASGPLGFTPLTSSIRNQVLKYNFVGIGRTVTDKSGHGNRGKMLPKEDPPKRKIVSWFPLEVEMVFDGENDYIKVPDDPSLRLEKSFTIEVEYIHKADPDVHTAIVRKRGFEESTGYILGVWGNSNRVFFAGLIGPGEVAFRAAYAHVPYDEKVKLTGVADFEEKKAYLKKNGEVVKEVPYERNVSISKVPLELGRFYGHLNGGLTSVKIYDRAIQ